MTYGKLSQETEEPRLHHFLRTQPTQTQISEERAGSLLCSMEQPTGLIVVDKIGGKSTVTRSFSKYPLKFILPNKVGSSQSDAVWIYTLTYGGGIVSGDSIACNFAIGDDCTAVLTTQASTKVYKSVGSKCSLQVLEARVGANSLLVVIPDPVTCFSTARYSQSQVFKVVPDSNLVIVDWFTSGRYERGEVWDFGPYKSTNNVFLEDGRPLFLDTMLLERGDFHTVAERMQGYQVSAMVILLGPKLKHVQIEIQENVKRIMSSQLQVTSSAFGPSKRTFSKPDFVASCSLFGPKGVGLIIRVVAMTTEAVYEFLQQQLVGLEPLIGVAPYR